MTGFGRILADLNRASVRYGSPIPEGSIVGNRTIHLATPHGDLDLLAENVAYLTDLEAAHGELPDSREPGA